MIMTAYSYQTFSPDLTCTTGFYLHVAAVKQLDTDLRPSQESSAHLKQTAVHTDV